MKVYIPKALLKTAQEFSKFKTPDKRTSGFLEQQGQKRGHGDILDTIASMMLTHYLAAHQIPCKYQLALLQGDDFDIETGIKNKNTINVKASNWQPSDDFSTANSVNYHMAIKESEFNKLNSIYQQVMVHLNPLNDNPHIHFCGWLKLDSLELPLENNLHFGSIPNTGGSKGLWIPAKILNPFDQLISALK